MKIIPVFFGKKPIDTKGKERTLSMGKQSIRRIVANMLALTIILQTPFMAYADIQEDTQGAGAASQVSSEELEELLAELPEDERNAFLNKYEQIQQGFEEAGNTPEENVDLDTETGGDEEDAGDVKAAEKPPSGEKKNREAKPIEERVAKDFQAYSGEWLEDPFFLLQDEYEERLVEKEINIEALEKNQITKSLLGQFGISSETPLMPELVVERVVKTTDRYIIKYKENSKEEVVEKLERDSSFLLRSVAVPESRQLSSARKEALVVEKPVIDRIVMDERIAIFQERYEVLVLEEAVAPSELAELLREMDIEEEIEYIQPDYELSLDSLELELVLPEKQTGDTPAQSEGEGGTQTEEDDTGEKDTDTGSADDGEENPSNDTAEEEGENPNAPSDPVEETPGDGEAGEPEDEEELDGNPEEELEEGDEEAEEEEELRGPVIVAIIDTGIDIYHPDLAEYIWVNEGEEAENEEDDEGNGYADDLYGWNFYGNNNELYTEDYPLSAAHGTHIAGMIAKTAEEYDADVQIMVLKVFEDGKAYTSDILAAIDYAVANGAEIINCSFGSASENPALAEKLLNVEALVVAAAGNNRRDLDEEPVYPAAYQFGNIISVASTNEDDGFSYYSNYGIETIDMAARGRDMVSSLPEEEEGLMSGTSMSAGLVTAAAAVLLDARALDTEELREELLLSADKLSNLQNKVIEGRRLNLENALGGVYPEEVLETSPEDDFDVHGYQPTVAETWELFSQSPSRSIEAGGYHSLALKEDGSVWSWGLNSNGQLGGGSTMGRAAPEQIVGATDAVWIAGGGKHSVMVKQDGTVWATGYNNYGQLGDGTTTDRLSMVQVSGLTGAVRAAANEYHSLALKEDGSVWSWGYNNYGQLGNNTTTNRSTPVQVFSLSGVAQIAAGFYHSLALKSDGTVWAWGYNQFGQLGNNATVNQARPVQVSTLSGVVGIAAGAYQSYALKADGTVWAWGYNSYGQLGNSATVNQTRPVQVSGLSGVVGIAAGFYHGLAVKSDGSVWSWGYNNDGQLGDGSATNRLVPVRVQQLDGIAAVGGGTYHSLALGSDGRIWAWGHNVYGQLGNGQTANSSVPVAVCLGAEWLPDDYPDNYEEAVVRPLDSTRLLIHGILHTAADIDWLAVRAEAAAEVRVLIGVSAGQAELKVYNAELQEQTLSNAGVLEMEAGEVYYFRLSYTGNGNFSAVNYGLLLLVGNGVGQIVENGVGQIAAGASHSLALKEDGSVWGWGHNIGGQLGLGDTVNRAIPEQAGVTIAARIAGGNGHTIVAEEDGTVWAAGANGSGQLGDGTITNRTSLVQVRGLTGAVSVAAGQFHSLALKSDGSVWAWGQNFGGQLGIGQTTDRTTPVQVSLLSGVIEIATGEYHNLALKSDGTVWAWGRNNLGQLGDNTTTDRFQPVQVSGLGGVVAIAAKAYQSYALKADGTVWAWGRNNSGQLGDNTTTNRLQPVQVSGLSNVIGIAAGGLHGLALKADGSVWSWGYNNYGQLGDGSTTNRLAPVCIQQLEGIVAVAAGHVHSLALGEDGRIWAWGYNYYGQLGNGLTTNSSVPVAVSVGADWLTDDYPNSSPVATLIELEAGVGQELTGQIDYASDQDWLKLRAAQGGVFTLSLESEDTDVSLRVYDALYQLIDRQANPIFTMEAEEILYLRVDYTGASAESVIPYAIQIGASGDDYPDSKAEAHAYPYELGESTDVSGVINSDGDEDWFVLEAQGVTAFQIAFQNAAGDAEYTVYDEELADITEELESYSSFAQLEKIYIKVSQSGPFVERAGYILSVSAEADDYGNNAERAAEYLLTVPSEQELSGMVQHALDQDWILLTAEDSGVMRLQAGAYPGALIRLYDSEMVDVSEKLNQPINVTEGTKYYLSIAASAQYTVPVAYQIEVGSWEDDDYGNGAVSAEEYELGARERIELSGAIDYSADEDWLALTAEEAANAWFSLEGANAGIVFTAYDSELQEITGTLTPYLAMEAEELIYLQVRYNGAITSPVSYDIIIEEIGAVHAVAADAGAQLSGTIADASASDWYAVMPIETAIWEAGLNPEAESLEMIVYDQKRSIIEEEEEGGYRLRKNKLYFIQVRQDPEEAFTVTAYTVDIQFLAVGAEELELELSTEQSELYQFALKGVGVESFADGSMEVEYDPTKLQLVDFATQTAGADITAGAVEGTGLTIVSHANGVIEFTFEKPIEAGMEWSGFITGISFEAITSDTTTLTVRS